MSNIATKPNIRFQSGGILIIHKTSSECAHCGASGSVTNYPCTGCGVVFKSAALSYVEPADPNKQIANLIADGWDYLRIIGWAANYGPGKWRISADPRADFNVI